MLPLRVLIADDEPIARERLRDLLTAEPSIDIVGECATGPETLDAIRQGAPQVVLLDIQLPELNGFEVIHSLRPDRVPVIVFVTAHDRFALRAFEAHAADYLLKPFDRDRFRQALARARERAESRTHQPSPGEIRALIEALQPSRKAVERFAVRYGKRIVFVKPAEIDWIQSADNYSELHTGDQVYLLRQTLTDLVSQLPPSQFVRISRSLMVNVDRIQEVRAKSHGDYHVRLKGGPELTGSRNYRAELLKLIGREGP